MMYPCIQTYTGKKFWPFNPDPADICIEDIAHALSLKCRFGGHSKFHYSVAYHSLLASEMAEKTIDIMNLSFEGLLPLSSRSTSICALLHDAAEAYMPDFAAPVKDLFRHITNSKKEPYRSIAKLEGILDRTIYEALGLPFPSGPDLAIVKSIDLRMLATERHQVMRPGFDWEGLIGVKPYQIQIIDRQPEVMEKWFLDKFFQLTEK